MEAISIKIILARIRDYLGYLQFAMISYIFITQTQFNLLHTIILVAISSIALAIIDWKIIYPAEQRKIQQKNPEWNKLMSKIEAIEKELKVKK